MSIIRLLYLGTSHRQHSVRPASSLLPSTSDVLTSLLSIADSEGEEVAWCTKKGYGTRLIPDGAITGIQFVKTPSYLQIAAFVDQTMLNIPADDYGGELDSGGQDGVRTCSLRCFLLLR